MAEDGVARRGDGTLAGALGALRFALLASLGVALAPGCGGQTEPSEPAVAPCSDSMDVGGGLERCAEGWLHRTAAVTCESTVPRPDVWPKLGGRDSCDEDADCARLPYGHCSSWRDGLPPSENLTCQAGCVSDADCGAGKICMCGSPVGKCVTATCTTDADCDGGLCATSTVPGACQEDGTRFDCQSPNDSCMTPEDCPPQQRYCGINGGSRSCSSGWVCGRPFLVDGLARLAELELGKRGDWSAALAPELSTLDAGQRLELAEHWGRMALMEHASIAAFARFVLELLSMGAPAELVREAQRAMQDELEHSELCFGLASAYAGRPIGPGPLAVDGALTGRSYREMVVTAYREACLGETQATAEARAALLRTEDPAVRRVLTRIAEDEARHAALGFRFLRFALESAGESEKRALLAELRAELDAAFVRAAKGEVTARALAAHGLLSESERAEARRAALLEVVVPCSRALFGASELAVPARHV